MNDETTAIYERVGGPEPFHALVAAFYAGVEQDAVLRPLYPDDLSRPKQHMTMFLIQRFGGPTQYSEQRGHPRLRMRHLPFRIGAAEKDAWLHHMNDAVDSIPEFAPFREALRDYFKSSAEFLVNHSEVPTVS
jgi:hemoglobin